MKTKSKIKQSEFSGADPTSHGMNVLVPISTGLMACFSDISNSPSLTDLPMLTEEDKAVLSGEDVRERNYCSLEK